ncbi:MAG: hypothetical protein KC425_22335, partial [Anaerolineales bacterium]|nr:hypothetical protein [Anaerolineales bacterium]
MSESNAAPQAEKKGFLQLFLEEITSQSVLIPVLAVFTGLILGAIIIIFTTEAFYEAWAVSPGEGLRTAWTAVSDAYVALFTSALGSPARIVAALREGDALEIRRAFNPFLESLVASTPYIFAGLSVAL